MESFKDKVEDLNEGLKERLKSPFILTFVTVWIIRHWELVYLTFNFGVDYTAIQKLKMIIIALKGEGYRELFWIPLFISLASFAIYLIVSLIYELIHSLYSKWGRTFIYYISDRSKLVKREDYDKLQKEFDELDTAYADLEESYENLKEDNLDKLNKLNLSEENAKNIEVANKEFEKKITILNSEIEEFKKLELKCKEIISNEERYFGTRTVYVVSQLLRYLFLNKVQSFHHVPVTQLFFGTWNKRINSKENNSLQLYNESIHFEGNSAIDTNKNFVFEILDVGTIMADDIYLITTKNNKGEAKAELLLKLDEESYLGLIGGFDSLNEPMYDIKRNFVADSIVQYKKLSAGK